ncbi:beta-ketoacyl-[acyl-carrier-protein] synthase family protein [bacterium]|nr:beta-ketoacyl-[acyl-carrier-protein] synthase family protein [bacterium]
MPHRGAKPRTVVITGLGCISVAGKNVSELKQILFHPRPLFTKPERVSLAFDIVAGEIPADWYAGELNTAYDTIAGRMSLLAARECLADAHSRGAGEPEALIVGSSAAGQEHNEKFVFGLLGNGPVPDHDFHKRGVVATSTRLLAQQLDIRGGLLTISTACTSSANSLALGAAWIETGRYDRVLVGGCDDICATTLSGFHALFLTGALPCRPFGQDRPGMTLGDGAAFLMLEAAECCLSAGRTWHAELVGYGLSVDAHHLTAPSEGGSGAVRAMKQALDKAGLRPEAINWINAHGTGTELNDRSESEAIHSLFPEATPVSSNKGLFGHTLGAAGALEAIVTIIALQSGRAPENYFQEIPGPDCPIRLVPPGGMVLPEQAHVLSNSFGFGGSNCSLLFRSPVM